MPRLTPHECAWGVSAWVQEGCWWVGCWMAGMTLLREAVCKVLRQGAAAMLTGIASQLGIAA